MILLLMRLLSWRKRYMMRLNRSLSPLMHLGLLVYPFTLVADLADRVAGLSNGEPVVHVPEIAYIQDNVKYVLIAEQDVNIYDQVNRTQIFLDIHKYYLMAMDAAIAMALVVLAWKKFDQITGGRDT